MLHSNPIVSDVISQFKSIEMMTRIFADSKNPSATKGLLISGDAGMGKTHAVDRGLSSSDNPSKIITLKGSSVTAAAFYAQLWFAREQGSVLVLDDVDIIHKSPAELMTILDLIKAATEMTKGERPIKWMRTTKNQFLKDNNIPLEFDFQGSIIWITNDSFESIAKKAKGHWFAINSRFSRKEFKLEQYEKVQYTLYLIDECGMLGESCPTREGGYSNEIVGSVSNYIRKHWKDFEDMTPRNALQLADTMFMYPNDWEMLVENQMLISK
jgi:hypothetical protein